MGALVILFLELYGKFSICYERAKNVFLALSPVPGTPDCNVDGCLGL